MFLQPLSQIHVQNYGPPTERYLKYENQHEKKKNYKYFFNWSLLPLKKIYTIHKTTTVQLTDKLIF